jgi:cation diffusion facilitator family transporter
LKETHAIKRVFLVTFALNLLVGVLQLGYGFWTDTLTMIADGFHSMMDMGSSLIGFVGVWIASKPSDEDHHYGHHKFESISTLGISFFILLTAWEIGKHALERITHPEEIRFHIAGIGIIVLSLIINFFVHRYEHKKAKEFHSQALEADAMHTASDVWVSVTVLISLLCIRLGWGWVDAALSLVIALYFVWAAFKILRKNFMVLSDAAFLDVEEIKALVLEQKEIIDCHHVRTRGDVGEAFIDLHIQVPPDMPTIVAHRVAHQIEDRIKNKMDGIREVLIHTEPFPDDDDTFVTDEIEPSAST